MNVDDVDQHLLQQFSCLGTTDKSELVKQLQRLLAGSQLNEATAAFFLDMNNWNLQAAICSYFDFEAPFTYPCMTLVGDSTIGITETLPPNTKFRKTWLVQNSGTEAWPVGISLQHTEGVKMGETQVSLPSLAPKETMEVSVNLTSPSEFGIYQSIWKMMTPTGSYFGDVIWMIITVHDCGTLELTEQLQRLSTSQSNDTQMC